MNIKARVTNVKKIEPPDESMFSSSSEPAGYGAWISVENPPVLELDENGFIRQRVMVFCEGEILLGYARKSYDGGVKFTADGRMGEWKITHWMSLPDAP